MSIRRNKKRESFRSNYGDFFGTQLPKIQGGEWAVLKFKKFSQLEWTLFLNDEMKMYLDKWQKLEAENCESKFKHSKSMHLKAGNKWCVSKIPSWKWDLKIYQLIINTLIALSSFIKGKMPTQTTQKVSFRNYDNSQIVKAERFDKLIDEVRMKVRDNFKNMITIDHKSKPLQRQFKLTSALKRVSTKINPKVMKLKFLKGKGNITNLFQPHSPTKETTYQNFFEGKNSKVSSKNVGELFRTSRGAGSLIPDPTMISMNESRIKYFKNDLEKFDHKSAERNRLSNMRSIRVSSKSIGKPSSRHLHKSMTTS